MSDYSHFVIVTTKLEKTEEFKESKKQILFEPKAYRQSFAFHMISPEVSWQSTEAEANKENYYVLGEGTFFLKKKGKRPDGTNYEITDEMLKNASDPPKPVEITGVFEPIKEVLARRTGFRFHGDYEIHERKILGFLYHLVLPEYFWINKNSISNNDNMTAYDPTLRNKRYTVTWKYLKRKEEDYPSFKGEVNFFYNESEWDKITKKARKTQPIPDGLKKLYREVKFWVPEISKWKPS